MPAAPNSIKASYSIASIPADGIGPEVIDAAITVLNTLAKALGTFDINFTHFNWDSDTYKKTGKYIPDGGLEELKKYDAILFGAVGAPDVPDHISLWSLRLAIVQPLQLYANVRPTRILRGTTSPLTSCVNTSMSTTTSSSPSPNQNSKKLDWLIIRENTEGEYSGHGGRSHIGQPHETATEISLFTRRGIERIMEFAFTQAKNRPRKMLTVVTKSNAQRNGMVLWDEIAAEVGERSEFKGIVTVDKMLVDAMTYRMVSRPESLDVIVATNLHADILSDLAAALAGSIGIAPTSNLDPTRQNPSMFEPIHGSAFDIVGKGIANPIGTLWSSVEMLKWLGEVDAGERLMDVIESVCERGIVTPDLGGTATTVEVTAAVCEEVKKRHG